MDKKKYTLREKLQYRFDERMSRGTGSMIFMLSAVTLAVIVLVSLAIALLDEESFAAAFWDSLATTVNAWMPYSGDGGIGYILLTALAAIVGLFFTSVLIGIFSSAIEDKVNALRSGNSRILEEGHIVLLGWNEGEYTLLRQLVEGAWDEKRTIVVADRIERQDLESTIRDNIECPDNVSILCRNVNICDTAELGCLSLDTAGAVIVNSHDDDRVIRAVLAVTKVLSAFPGNSTRVVAYVSDDGYMLPMSTLIEKNIYMLQTDAITARMIAHSCTEPGLSSVFSELLSCQGCELYVESLPGAAGYTYGQLALSAEGGQLAGIWRDGSQLLNPDPDEPVNGTDLLITISEEEGYTHFVSPELADVPVRADEAVREKTGDRIVILGSNELLPYIAAEVSDYSTNVTVAEEWPAEPGGLAGLVADADHVIILGDHGRDSEEADSATMLTVIKLRDIKKRSGLSFTLTAELFRESDRALILSDDADEFIVAADLSSTVIAQLTEEYRRVGLLRELLSNAGNELYNKSASMFAELPAEMPLKDLRRIVMEKRYQFVGYAKGKGADRRFFLNPDMNGTVRLEEGDSLVVIGEK